MGNLVKSLLSVGVGRGASCEKLGGGKNGKGRRGEEDGDEDGM